MVLSPARLFLHRSRQENFMEECLELKSADITALDSGVKSLIVVQRRALVILTTRRVAPIDRRAAELQGMGGGETAVILKDSQSRIDIRMIACHGCEAAAGDISDQIETGTADRSAAIWTTVIVLSDNAVL
jgi:hypothetical protein